MAPEVTYEHYKGLWGGGLAEDAFAQALPEAEARVRARLALIDLATLDEACTVAYRRAVCAACERIAKPKAGSWTSGKASMSYLEGDTGTMTVNAAIERCIAGTPLSYTGI